LEAFVSEKNKLIACDYLGRLGSAGAAAPLKDARKGDVLLVESIDRLSRLPADD